MLKIEIKQQNACFKIPQMGNPILTYPLAPPSTVFGLLRYITSYQSINKDNTKIAISGIYESKLRHIITNHITGVSDDGKYKSNIIPTEELYNVTHIIHIESKNDFEKSIKDNINKSIRFGRQEDLITEIECKEVKQNSINGDIDYEKIKNLNHYIYLPFENFRSLSSLAMFNASLDSNKELLDEGALKMYYTKLLFMKIQRFIMNIVDDQNSNEIFIDSDGYLYVWIN